MQERRARGVVEGKEIITGSSQSILKRVESLREGTEYQREC